jgi:GNAT superfamily N-acetyltransferase
VPSLRSIHRPSRTLPDANPLPSQDGHANAADPLLTIWQPGRVVVRAAATDQHWRDAAALLFAYHRETALEVGQPAPARPEEVWAPVRAEVLDPASVFSTYLLAVEESQALGGMALTLLDKRSLMLKRCYVRPANRRRGVARALVAAATEEARRRDMSRMVLDILPSRTGAVTAWRRLGFIDAEPWGDDRLVYLERPLAEPTGD